MQINSVSGVGSTGRITSDIHNILVDHGHESYIAYGRKSTENIDNLIKIGSRYENYLHVASTRVFDNHGFGSSKATREFIKSIENINPDLIHLHNIHGYYINVKILFNYLKKANKRVIWTLHDCWPFTGHCAYFDFIGCDKWKTQCNSCPEKNSYPSSLFLDNSKRNYLNKKEIFTGVKDLTIVTPSKWLASLVKESLLGQYPIKVINNGIDTETFKVEKSDFRKKFNIEDKYVILGVASAWDRRKGLRYFYELSNNLKKDEVIVLVGLTEKQIEGLPKNIIGISRTNNVKELVQIYSASDVFVNPTLEDNFPTTNLEALACGIPVITFNTGGSVESIDTDTGIITEKGDVRKLENGIQKIKKVGKEFYSDSCMKRAKEFFNKNDRYLEYMKLYKELVD
nr:glycosyltransferase [Robertmurraya korlensis]